ncbi:MAG: ABC transporter ATP-binding protein [Oscillospiraceae bacterium]|jgi:ATP-binding cassette subfamily B multidrug efflux pump
MKKVFFYLKPYLPRMSVGLLIKFTGTIMDLALPWILSYMIDDIVPLKDVPLILVWGGIMVLCAIVAVVTNIVANRMASWVAQHTTQALRHDLFHKITYLSCKQIDEFTIPSLESRLTTDTYNIHQMIGMMQRLGVRAPILLLGGVLVTLTLDPILCLVLVSTMPFIGFLIYFVSKKGIPLYVRLQQGVDAMVRTVRENIAGIRVIKALSKTDYEKNRFAGVNTEVVRRETKAATTMALTNPMMNLFLNLGLTAVIFVGAVLVNSGMTQPGKIIAFLTYFTIILNAMLSITRMFVMYSKGTASAERISEVLNTPEDLTLTAAEPASLPYYIVFDHVSFSYQKKEDNVTDISFRLRRGETLGIIGATGCGKSTLISLLMRLYDADSGDIFIDSRKIESIPPEELHTKFGVVFQNDILFADTIAENISFGRSLPPEQIRKAAECAQAAEFINALSDGYEHMLTAKGTNLSGGQKQRLLIARALAGNPEILILDDSSSALDYRTDAQLRRALAQEYQGTTTVIIAQRISSILHADHILVLEDGRELGYGTHEELMQSCALYREISQSQMGGGGVA